MSKTPEKTPTKFHIKNWGELRLDHYFIHVLYVSAFFTLKSISL